MVAMVPLFDYHQESVLPMVAMVPLFDYQNRLIAGIGVPTESPWQFNLCIIN